MKKIAILLLLMACMVPAQLMAKVYLVSIGISDYPGRDSDLSLCDGDARDMVNLYRKNNGAEVRLLTNRQATCQAAKKAMNELFNKAQANDIVVLFYSGHGEKKGLNLYDATLSFKEIMRIFDSLRCKNKMIFSDSCFSGNIRSKATLQLSDVGLTNNVMFFLGSRSNEYSIENGSEFTNSYFTHALIRGLSGKADTNRNRIISAKELFTYVSKHVKNYSNNKQHPVMWGHFSDDMPVMKW